MEDKFVRACMGKSASQGGMNIDQFREEFKRRFPQLPLPATRKGLNELCAHHVDVKKYTDKYYGESVEITDKHKKYCRCVVKVIEKSPKECNKKTKPYSIKGCYNPYAVCSKSVGRPKGKFECLKYMKMNELTESELAALERYKLKKLTEEDFYQE